MKYSEAALFTLAIVAYEKNGINKICGNKNFTCDKFYKRVISGGFAAFQKRCEVDMQQIDEFYQFLDAIRFFLDSEAGDLEELEKTITPETAKWLREMGSSADGFICFFDKEFPYIYQTVKNADKPFLLFYKGDISLFADLNKNVAVIGVLNPDANIKEREKRVVQVLAEKGMNIVSGLAKGCDTIAHQTCLDANGKTIAILPSPLCQITPSENRELAAAIVENGGLLVTEYFKAPKDKYEATKRYIDRDRLQAMFSKAIILSASYNVKALGDCGSRHAMGKAEEYNIYRGIIYDEKNDFNNTMFGLNKEYYENKKAVILTAATLQKIIAYKINKENKNLKSAIHSTQGSLY